MDNDNIRSITLRVAVFFGLTTFTLCIAIFYIQSILGDTQDMVFEKDSIIQEMEKDLSQQEIMIKENETQIRMLKDRIEQEEGITSEVAE